MTTISDQPYLYGYVNNERFEIENSVEQICAFIMKYQLNDTQITDIFDNTEITTTFGGFIMSCRKQQFLQKKLLPILVSFQRGEKEIVEFIPYEVEEEFVVKKVCFLWNNGLYAVSDVSFECCKDEDYEEEDRVPIPVEQYSQFFKTKEELFSICADPKILSMEEANNIAKEKDWI